MKIYSILLPFILLSLINSCSNGQQKWIKYKSDKFDFKIEFPKTPFEKTQLLDAAGGQLKLNIIGADCQKDNDSYNVVYLASYYEFPESFFDGFTKETYETFFHNTINGMVNHQTPNDGHLSESQVIDFQGCQGREVKIVFNKGQEINSARFILNGNKMYTLLVTSHLGKYPNPDIQTFFNSFELLSFSSLNASNPNNPAVQDIKSWYAGNTTVYNSTGNPKSKNLVFSIRYLNSWQVQDGDRPMVVKKFIKPIGSNLICCMVLVRNYEGIPLKEDIDNFSKSYESLLPSGSILLSKNSNMIVDGERALLVETKEKRNPNQTVLGTSGMSYFHNYEVFYKDYWIEILFAVRGLEDNDELFKLFTDYKEFFKLAASSFVIQSKWQ